MKEADIFESWINRLAEGTWATPKKPEQLNKLKELMSKELIVGPDGTNATEQLYSLVGDDILFDRIDELAADTNGKANVWDDSVVQARLQELGIDTSTIGQHWRAWCYTGELRVVRGQRVRVGVDGRQQCPQAFEAGAHPSQSRYLGRVLVLP